VTLGPHRCEIPPVGLQCVAGCRCEKYAWVVRKGAGGRWPTLVRLAGVTLGIPPSPRQRVDVRAGGEATMTRGTGNSGVRQVHCSSVAAFFRHSRCTGREKKITSRREGAARTTYTRSIGRIPGWVLGGLPISGTCRVTERVKGFATMAGCWSRPSWGRASAWRDICDETRGRLLEGRYLSDRRHFLFLFPTTTRCVVAKGGSSKLRKPSQRLEQWPAPPTTHPYAPCGRMQSTVSSGCASGGGESVPRTTPKCRSRSDLRQDHMCSVLSTTPKARERLKDNPCTLGHTS
jgi:hypothetical protein